MKTSSYIKYANYIGIFVGSVELELGKMYLHKIDIYVLSCSGENI